jgi:hypothetical protein
VIDQYGVAGRRLQRVPAEKALKFAVKWLAKRESKQVSGHIARHGRRIAGRVIHTIFKSPKDIKWLLDRTLKHATEVVERNASTGVIEEAGIKIEQQSATRWAVSKTFRSAIGTEGETVLRMIINHNGRIVTAYPVRALAVLGLTVAVFDEQVAQAAEGVASVSQEAARRQQEKDDSLFGDWEEWIPYLGDIFGGSLNENEDLYLREDQQINRAVNALQDAAQQTWSPEQRQKVVNLVSSAIAAPYYVEGDDSSASGPTGMSDQPAPDWVPADDSATVPV